MALNKKDIGTKNTQKLKAKIEKVRAGEDRFPLNKKNRLINRSELAKELGFGRSVWSQNPDCAGLLQAAEKEFFGSTGTSNTSQSNPYEIESEELKRLRHRNLKLEKKVAALTAENEAVVSALEKKDLETQKFIKGGKTFDI